MKTGTTIAVVGGGLALLALVGGGVYLATRGPAREQLGGSDAEAQARIAEARAAQARADAAKATAEAQKAAAQAADKPFLEELGLAVIEAGGDFLGGLASGGKLF